MATVRASPKRATKRPLEAAEKDKNNLKKKDKKEKKAKKAKKEKKEKEKKPRKPKKVSSASEDSTDTSSDEGLNDAEAEHAALVISGSARDLKKEKKKNKKNKNLETAVAGNVTIVANFLLLYS